MAVLLLLLLPLSDLIVSCSAVCRARDSRSAARDTVVNDAGFGYRLRAGYIYQRGPVNFAVYSSSSVRPDPLGFESGYHILMRIFINELTSLHPPPPISLYLQA
eukprot:467447-Hanusia_phi.AAC.2